MPVIRTSMKVRRYLRSGTGSITAQVSVHGSGCVERDVCANFGFSAEDSDIELGNTGVTEVWGCKVDWQHRGEGDVLHEQTVRAGFVLHRDAAEIALDYHCDPTLGPQYLSPGAPVTGGVAAPSLTGHSGGCPDVVPASSDSSSPPSTIRRNCSCPLSPSPMRSS